MDKKISDLQENLPIDGTENIVNQKGTDNFKNTYTQLKDWILTFITTVFIQTKRPLKDVNGESLEGNGNIVTPNTEYTDVEIKTKYESNADTNAFTDAEKANLANQSGTNTGDETTLTIQTKRPLKTVNGESVEGTGDIDINKSDVGLGNVDNTSDADKPISTATQTALDDKADDVDLTNHINDNNNPHSVTATQVGLGNVDNTSDLDKPVSNDQQTALDGKEDSITAGTTAQYFRGDKTFQTLDKSAVGLGNVDNTSDLNKPISTATQTALNTKLESIPNAAYNVVGGIKISRESSSSTTYISFDGTDTPNVT